MPSSPLLYLPDFSNILSKAAIERLADVDEFDVVREVQVCWGDARHHFCSSFLTRNILPTMRPCFLVYFLLIIHQRQGDLSAAPRQMCGIPLL